MLPRTHKLLEHLRKQRKMILLASLALIGQAAMVIMLPYSLKLMIDGLLMEKGAPELDYVRRVIGTSREDMLVVLAVVVVLLSLLSSVLDYLEQVLTSEASARTVAAVRRDMMEFLISRKFSSFERWRKIDLLGRISGDTENLELLITGGLAVLVRAIPSLVFVLVMMVILDWKLSFILATAVPAMYWLGRRFSNQLRVGLKKFRAETILMEQEVYQVLMSIQLVKSLSIERLTGNALETRINRIIDLNVQTHHAEGAMNASMSITRNLVRLFVLVLGGYAVLQGQFGVGSLVLFLTYAASIEKPISEITKFTSKYHKMMVSLERIEDLFSSMSKEKERGGNLEFLPTSSHAPHLMLEGVSFGYDRSPLLLNQFSADFGLGQAVALIGPSGCGKSTFAKLINRLMDPVEGSLLLAGEDLRGYTLEYLRNEVTVISQDSFFIPGTVRANIELGSRGEPLTDEQIWAALRRSNADEFVRAMPEGLDTMIGEGHRQLSGGQQRRLSIARAFVRFGSSVYLFDEPTSGLDPRSSRVVLQSIRDLARTGALVFWVTHHMDEVAEADRVLFFRPGANPVLSSHDELMKSHIGYRSLFSKEHAL